MSTKSDIITALGETEVQELTAIAQRTGQGTAACGCHVTQNEAGTLHTLCHAHHAQRVHMYEGHLIASSEEEEEAEEPLEHRANLSQSQIDNAWSAMSELRRMVRDTPDGPAHAAAVMDVLREIERA